MQSRWAGTPHVLSGYLPYRDRMGVPPPPHRNWMGVPPVVDKVTILPSITLRVRATTRKSPLCAVHMQGVGRECLLVLSGGREVVSPGPIFGGYPLVLPLAPSTLPRCEQTDRQMFKHYLPACDKNYTKVGEKYASARRSRSSAR